MSWAALAGLVLCVQGCASTPAAPRDYCFSPRGSDAGGLGTADRPYQSVAKANGLRLHPGDRLLFEAGQAFDGNLVVTQGGTPENPVHVGSYGTGRATIRAGEGTAVLVRNAGGVRVADLVCLGDGPGRNHGSGVEFLNAAGGNTRLRFARVEAVEAAGFGKEGIVVHGDPRDFTPSGYDDVLIDRCSAHDNVHTGIFVTGHFDARSRSGGTHAHRDVRIVRCLTYDNPGDPDAVKENRSGSGIFVESTDGAVIEHCEASNNGARNRGDHGGPVGIWATLSNRVAIQFCRSHHNRTGGRFDGGGFCLDGGVTHSVMQFNVSHDNDGSGYGLFEYAGIPPAHDNVVRFNVSRDDGRKNAYAGIHLWNGGVALERVEIHNNEVTLSPATGVAGAPPRAVWVQEGCSDVRVFNNRFVAGPGVTMVDVAGGQRDVAFRGNEYRASGKAAGAGEAVAGVPAVQWQGRKFAFVDEWTAATRQEAAAAAQAAGLWP